MVCEGLEGENLAERALAEAPRPGLGRAAAADRDREADPDRRRARRRQRRRGRGPAPRRRRRSADLPELAAELGADVPSQLVPALSLVRGAGERVERLPDPAPHAVVLLPGGGGLSTARVFEEADRLGLGRERGGARRDRGRAARGRRRRRLAPRLPGPARQRPRAGGALAVRPEIEDALDSLRGAGAGHAMLTGTGPTAVGVCEDLAAAERVAAAPRPRADAIVCEAGRAPDGT